MDFFEHYGKYIITLSLFTVFILLFFNFSSSALEKYISKNTEQKQVYATVTDKHSNIVNAAMPGIIQYYIEVKLGTNDQKQTIQISENQYYAIEKDQDVLCTIYIKDNKIIFAELSTKEFLNSIY